VTALVDTACHWREEHFLGEPDAAHEWFERAFPRVVPSADFKDACARFDDLYLGVCRALGQPEPPAPAGAQAVRSFPIRMDEIEMDVFQSVEEGVDRVFVLIPLAGADNPERELAVITSAMELNFQLFTENRAASVTGRPDAEGFLLVYGYPLDGGTPQGFLEIGRRLAELARQWRLESH
jgi:hypothetical protein